MIIQLSNQLFKNLELETQNHYRDIEELEYQIKVTVAKLSSMGVSVEDITL